MPNNHNLKASRRLRLNMTDAEARLWYLLRDRRLSAAKFRRQVPVGPYVVDFYCYAQQLVIEADGGQHMESARDAVRDQFLQQQGLRILRFWNDEILTQQERVLAAILHALRAPSPRLAWAGSDQCHSPLGQTPDAAASPRGRGNSNHDSNGNNTESAA